MHLQEYKYPVQDEIDMATLIDYQEEILCSINKLNLLGLINLRAKDLAQKPKCSAKNTIHNRESGDLLFQ